ncbi:hypothetical protein LFM09_01070 [Lentzea alba]|uniref:hypothetical protein n=1 Tax=Lentzea alba TaxID=2714351 RepID=UPI0039BF6388
MVAQTLDDEFLALLCEDEDLVRAEFDEIIEANWGEPPLPPAPRRPVPSTPYREMLHPREQNHVPLRTPARQRSPPPRKAGDAWKPRTAGARPADRSHRQTDPEVASAADAT